MKFLPITFKVWLLKLLYQDIASLGDGGDTELAHINKKESELLISIGGSGTLNAITGLREYKGGGGGGTSETKQSIDPAILPYITYGLEEAQDLYKAPGPTYYPDQTYVDPSAQTTEALGLAEARARAGSPLIPAAQSQALSTIQGDRLSATNPYFASMMANAAKPVVNEFNTAIIGQTQEQYSADALNSAISRYEYGQNAPQQKLGSYLAAAYGAPTPINQTATQTGGGK